MEENKNVNTTSDNGNSKDDTTSDKTNLSNILASKKFWLSVALIGIYIIFIFILFNNVDAKEPKWSRYIFLFTGIEALVFAAVGYVFGRDISRKKEEIADQTTEDAKKEVEESKREKESIEKQLNQEKEQLIALREAVIAEHTGEDLGRGLGSFAPLKKMKERGPLESTIGIQSKTSRAYNLALEYSAALNYPPKVRFDYTIEVDGFNSISIGGKTKNREKGTFSGILAPGMIIDVEVDRDNDKASWEFKASKIYDQRGRAMQMNISPLKSDDLIDNFTISYED